MSSYIPSFKKFNICCVQGTIENRCRLRADNGFILYYFHEPLFVPRTPWQTCNSPIDTVHRWLWQMRVPIFKTETGMLKLPRSIISANQLEPILLYRRYYIFYFHSAHINVDNLQYGIYLQFKGSPAWCTDVNNVRRKNKPTHDIPLTKLSTDVSPSHTDWWGCTGEYNWHPERLFSGSLKREALYDQMKSSEGKLPDLSLQDMPVIWSLVYVPQEDCEIECSWPVPVLLSKDAPHQKLKRSLVPIDGSPVYP